MSQRCQFRKWLSFVVENAAISRISKVLRSRSHCQIGPAGRFRANMRHLDVIQSPRQLARPGPVRADLCEEPAAQLAGKLLAGNCGRSAAADEAK